MKLDDVVGACRPTCLPASGVPWRVYCSRRQCRGAATGHRRSRDIRIRNFVLTWKALQLAMGVELRSQWRKSVKTRWNWELKPIPNSILMPTRRRGQSAKRQRRNRNGLWYRGRVAWWRLQARTRQGLRYGFGPRGGQSCALRPQRQRTAEGCAGNQLASPVPKHSRKPQT